LDKDRIREDLERDIKLHMATLSDPKNIKSGPHLKAVQKNLSDARAKLREIG